MDGHDIRQMVRILKEAEKIDHTVLIHVLTKKGKGYDPAERHPEAFHGVNPFDIMTGQPLDQKKTVTYTGTFSEELCRLAAEDEKIVAVTAAMPDGTGLKRFSEEFPDRFFDVGIAEQHAVTSAAGMAAAGLKPVVAVYSSFLQRAFDQIMMDVCLQELPVVFCIDRAGLVGSDGETHQGILDLTYMSAIPNMTVMAPKNAPELRAMLRFAFELNRPVAIRYPRGNAYTGLESFQTPVAYGKSEMLYEEDTIALLCRCSLINGRFIKPVDFEMIDRIAAGHRYLVTLEENVLRGGYGEQVLAYVESRYPDLRVICVTLPDAYVEHGNVTLLRSVLGIDSDSIMKQLCEEIPCLREKASAEEEAE